jgi:hypothetical protein
VASPGHRNLPPVSIRFDREEWREEVERLDEHSESRIQAERARREIEGGKAALGLQKCEADDEASGTRLLGCVKSYVPLGRQGASEAPFGFVFQCWRKTRTAASSGTSLPSGSAIPTTRLPAPCTSAPTSASMGVTQSDLAAGSLPPCQLARHAGGGTRTPDTRIMIPLL